MNTELRKLIKLQLEAANIKVEDLKLQYTKTGNDLEYWVEQTKALISINARLSIEEVLGK